jgi:predicted dehydrogenase
VSDPTVLQAAGSHRAVVGSRPRVGFLGVGWIGRHRMEALLGGGMVDAVGVADPAAECRDAALALAPAARAAADLTELLGLGLDGLVIATPSAQHADQAIQALEAGVSVFCQKPLGRSAAETAAVVDAARRADRFLAVDLSYRFTEGMRRIRDLVRGAALGRVFACDLVFHNAYGPDKAWFYDPALSGGGCVMDLGVHLVDLALWTLDFPRVTAVSSVLTAGGHRLPKEGVQAEDHAIATLELETGAVVRLACSWRLHAGRDAEIAAAFYGSAGGAALRNVDGSFYDFTAERFEGVSRTSLATPPDDWGGRAATAWARRLASASTFDPGCERLIDVATVLDRIYGR